MPSPAAAVDNQGPPCTDIKGRGGTIYKVLPDSTAPVGTATFHFEFFIADTPCSFATYFLYVTDASGNALRTATYPATAGNDTLTLCGATKFCYDQTFGATPGGAPSTIFVTGASFIQTHQADSTPTVDYVLCDTNTADATYPDCPVGDNSWDQ
jgi:hypothetical protein